MSWGGDGIASKGNRNTNHRILKTVCVWWELHQTSGMFLVCSLQPVDRHSLQNRNYIFTASFFFFPVTCQIVSVWLSTASRNMWFIIFVFSCCFDLFKVVIKNPFCVKVRYFFSSPSPVANYCFFFVFFFRFEHFGSPSPVSPLPLQLENELWWNMKCVFQL